MTENSSRFFANKACRYYPCHADCEELNCLFCYCPMYFLPKCPGAPEYIERDGVRVKKCAACSFPHRAENYEKVTAILKNYLRTIPPSRDEL